MIPAALEFLLDILSGLFFFIILPAELWLREINGLVIFIISVFGFIASKFLRVEIADRLWLPHYEEWKKTINEMGLKESLNPKCPEATGTAATGNYRNHHIEICQLDYATHDNDTDEYPEYKTRYIVKTENPERIQIYLKNRHYTHKLGKWWEEDGGYIKEIKVNEPEFDYIFQIKVGNEVSDIKQILNPSIRAKIKNLRYTLYELYIGYTLTLNNLCYIDSQPTHETKEFRFIVDTLIDIVEKIETYTPT